MQSEHNKLTDPLETGDSLVTENGKVVTINDIDSEENEAVCDDSGYRSEQRYDLEKMKRAIESGDYKLVRDSDLTEISGVGDATAPEIVAKTGCENPTELVEKYLTERNGGVTDAVRRMGDFHVWIGDNIVEIDIDVSLGQFRVFLFAVQSGCDPRMSNISNDEAISTHKNVDQEAFIVDDIEWEQGNIWINPSNTVSVSRGMDPLAELQDEEVWNALLPCDSVGKDGANYRFTLDGSETLVKGEFVDNLQEIFSFDIESVMCHPEGNHPVVVSDEETDLYLTIAPRIQTN